MNAIVILLNLALLVIGIFSIIAYYSNKRMLKNRESIVRENLVPCRTVSEQEIAAVSKFYKKNISPDTMVYKIEGVLEKISLTVNHNTSSEYWIGGIQIFTRIGKAAACFFEDDLNVCEIVYLHKNKKQAYPLAINSCSIHQAFKGRTTNATSTTTTERSADPFVDSSYRDASKLEQHFIGRKFRWSAYLFLLPLMALFSPSLFVAMEMNVGSMTIGFPFLIIGGCFLLLSLIFLLKKRSYKEGRKEIHCIRGILQESSERKIFRKVYELKGTKYKFVLPRKYAKNFQPQESVEYPIDVYVKNSISDITGVILRTDSFSIENYFEKRLVKFYRPFVVEALFFVLLGLFHLCLAGSGTPFFNDSSLGKVIEYYRFGPKIVTEVNDLNSLEAGDMVIFENLLSIGTDYRGHFVPIEDNLFDTIDLQPQAERFAIDLADLWNQLSDVFELYLRYDNLEAVSLFDESFFTETGRSVHSINGIKMNEILYNQWIFDDFSSTGVALRAAFERNDRSEDIHSLLLDLVDEMKVMIRISIEKTADYAEDDIMYSLTRYPVFSNMMSFDMFNDDITLGEYIDPRWDSYDPDVLTALIFESMKGLFLSGYLNGPYYVGNIKIAGESNYYDYNYDTYSFGNLNVFKRVVLSYGISLGFMAAALVILLILLLLKLVDYIRCRSESDGSVW